MLIVRLFYTISIIVLLSLQIEAKTCVNQNITFLNQYSIDHFVNQCSNCNIIDTDAVISGFDIANLMKLSKIENVSGGLPFLEIHYLWIDDNPFAYLIRNESV